MSLLSLLASKMMYMQLFESAKYRTLSDKNRINFVLLSPARGQIYDVNGIVLAINQACFKLLLDKNITANYHEELRLIFSILNFSEEKIGFINSKIKKANVNTPCVILDNLTWEEMAVIEEQKLYLKSCFIDTGFARFYPFSDSACHMIGYIGQINEQEKQDLKINNLGDFYVGKFGLEKHYEERLRGEFGYKQVEVNAVGKHVREIASFNSSDGEDLYLNIDIELQHKIQPYLNKQGCSVIVMDVMNGNVLILAMSPVFETNNFIKLSHDYWQTLINDPYKPLINKIVQSTYPPGSVFKIITILAALEHGITPEHSFNCTGASVLGSNSFRCWRAYGHGKVNMYNAIKYSCNTYMYEVGRLVGFRKILNIAQKFGFGQKTGVDLTGEVSGFLPSAEWKAKKMKSQWSIGDTLNLSIGQGFLLSTPIQLASFSTAIASNGKLYKPRIAQAEPLFEQVDIQQKHLDILKEGMYKAVNTEGGTAYYSRILGDKKQLAGKTGTAQVQSKASIDDDLSRDNIAWGKRNHAIFMGFAPYHQPRYSILVYLDHGGGGGKAAAPIASKIMSMVLNKYA